MLVDYEDNIGALRELQKRFKERSRKDPQLYHLVCDYKEEPLNEEVWHSFMEAYHYLPQHQWHEWHTFPDYVWCGLFFGVGESKPEFDRLATDAFNYLAALGEENELPVSRPPYGRSNGWLKLLYEYVALSDSDTPPICTGYFQPWKGRIANITLLEELANPLDCWSRPNKDGVSHPLYPSARMIGFETDMFFVSSAVLHWLLEALPSLCERPDDSPDFTGIEPNWDENTGRLTIGEYVVKEYKREASRQTALLRAFQKAGWPTWLSDSDIVDAQIN